MHTYIHYGSDKFDKTKFHKIKNRSYPWDKPEADTGLWACRTDDEHCWKTWCENEDFNTNRLATSFKFVLTPSASVYTIEDVLDLDGLPDCVSTDLDDFHTELKLIDFEKCLELGIDAIELVDVCSVRYQLDTWDVNCILILNPNIVMEIEES